MAVNTADDWTSAPYAEWLEQSIQELVNANPSAIAMEMVGEDGLVATCYYNASPNDRACMIDAMRDDARIEFIKNNADLIVALLNGDDEDEECEDCENESPETDS